MVILLLHRFNASLFKRPSINARLPNLQAGVPELHFWNELHIHLSSARDIHSLKHSNSERGDKIIQVYSHPPLYSLSPTILRVLAACDLSFRSDW